MRASKKGAERRKHARFAVVEGMVEPITVNFDATTGTRRKSSAHAEPPNPRNQPAILTDLSAGGMSLILFLEPPKTKNLDMVLSLPGLMRIPIEGRVVRVLEKGQTYNVGIAFTKISKKHQAQIDEMAQDHLDCETRLSLQLPEACVPKCQFHTLCAKPQKAPHWSK
jgi:hypothetical protein